MFFYIVFFRYFVIFGNFGGSSGLRLALFWGAKKSNKGRFFPQRLPGASQGRIWDPFLVDLGGIFDVLLDLFSMLFSLCSSSVFDMGEV